MKGMGNSLLVAGGTDALDDVLAGLAKEGISTEANPDLFVKVYAQFGVEDARDVRERAQLTGARDRRVFVLVAPVLTTEAQNALLKTLEDAPGDALFIIVVPSPAGLLSTVRSRSQVWDIVRAPSSESPVDADLFLRAHPKERLDMLKPLLEKNDDDKRDTAAILAFLAALEHALSHTRVHASAIESIYRARKYITDKGSLIKPLLEQVALLVPVRKA